MYFVADQPVTVTVDFKVNGEFVVPTAASVLYTLKGPTGAAYSGHDGVALTVVGTSHQLTLPALVNGKTRTVENRYLIVQFDYNGRRYYTRADYRLTDFLLHSVTPDAVRGLLGVTDRELADETIDLVKAYYDTSDIVSVSTSFATALQDNPIAANDAIACSAALNAIPSLQLAIAGEEGTDSSNYKRITGIDFDKLANHLALRFAQATQNLTGVTGSDTTLAVFATPTDPITGA
jgi:hypothetical protein